MRSILTLFILSLAVPAFCQQPQTTYKVTGTIKDPKGAVIGGLRMLENEKYSGAVTDINGEFQIELSLGDHLLTLGKFYDLRLFLKIVDGGPNPDNFELTVDPGRVCCFLSSGAAFPKPIVLPKPAYPPAAKVIGARGEVIVTVKVDNNGSVTSATAESGHPLLKGTAVAAAKSARFESSTAAEREARLTYIFLWDEKPREGLFRYSNQYRIEIVAEFGIY